MKFSEKLRLLRKQKALTQAQAAQAIDVPLRTYQTYEAGTSYPKNTQIYARAASYYGVSIDYLMGAEEKYISDARERGGAAASRQVAELLSRAGGLFAGGELTDDDKELVMKSLYDLYWDAKEKNRKSRPADEDDTERGGDNDETKTAV